MNMKEKFFKFKRFMRRNKEDIGRGFSITLTLILVVALAIISVDIYKADKKRAADALIEKDETSIEIEKGWDYGEPGFNQVAENDYLIMEADYTTGEICITEKKTGNKWYTNPPDRANDMIVPIRSKINSQLHVHFFDLEEKVGIDLDNYAASIRKGGMSHELVDNGVKFTFAFPQANVYIPVQYTLCGDAFQAEILTSEIEYVGDYAYMIESIAFLPYFGAGGLEDEGYLFVPDGSGSLINFNNNKQMTQTYTAPVYGRNKTLAQDKAETLRERISLPVFGVKCNDGAFLGVIISGDSSSTITAATSKKNSSYNMVYSNAIYREYTLTFTRKNPQFGQDTTVFQYSDNMMGDQNYAVRYFFLEEDKADYVGMSARYRQFLEESGRLKESKLADNKYLVLDLVGAVSINKYVFGIERPVVTALTTYNDVVTIVKELKARGVDNLIVNYIGALNSGLDNKIYSVVKTESALGTKKEFQAMVDYLKEAGVELFLESNPVEIYAKGNGYDNNGDAVRTFFDRQAFQYTYNLDSGKTTSIRWHLLKPELIPKVISEFTESAGKWGINNVSFEGIGEILYTNYADGIPSTTKAHTMAFCEEALKKVNESANYLMVHGGNAYCAPYADIIADTAFDSSNFDMTDRSVPFYQLVFQGDTVVTGSALNTTVDYTRGFLQTLENGCSLKYNLIYSDVSALVGTKYNTMVSYSYEFWKDIIVEEYHQLQKNTQQFAGEQITAHEVIADDVILTAYESGKIIINYRDEAFTYEGVEIGARESLVITGGAK